MNAVMRTTARGAIWATALLVASSCLAQTSGYPNRPVKVIVPFPPGGATDVIVRLITQRLSASLGQPFYAENHAGAGGNIGHGRERARGRLHHARCHQQLHSQSKPLRQNPLRSDPGFCSA